MRTLKEPKLDSSVTARLGSLGEAAGMKLFLIMAAWVGVAGCLLAFVRGARRDDEERATRESGPLTSRSFEIRLGLLVFWLFLPEPHHHALGGVAIEGQVGVRALWARHRMGRSRRASPRRTDSGHAMPY